MKKHTYAGVCTLIGLVGLAGVAVGSDRVSARYTILTPSEGDFEDDVVQHEFKVGGNLQVLDTDTSVLPLWVGGAYQANIWDFDNSSIDDLDLHKVQVPVATAFQLTDEIPVKVTLVPGIHSDFEDVDSDDFQFNGSVKGTYDYSDTMTIVLGVGFGEDFGDPTAFPIVGLKWAASDVLQVDLVFPKPRVTYTWSEDLRIFASGEPAGGQWNVGDDGDRQVDVQQEGFRVGAGAEYQVNEGGWLYAMVGGEFEREFSLAVDEDEVVDDRDLDEAVYFQVGYRLH